MTQTRVFLALLCALTTAWSAGEGGTPTCSCVFIGGEFLVESGTEIPRNMRGIPWAGHLRWENAKPQIPDAEEFSVVRLLDGATMNVGFELELRDGALIRDGDQHRSETLVLVAPHGGFSPGGRYRISYWFRRWEHAWLEQPPPPEEVEITVSAEAFSPSTAPPPTLRVGEVRKRRRRVEAGASCSREINAVEVDVELLLPPELAPWREALLFSTRLESGRLWRPSTGLCTSVWPGMSWVARGSERIFVACHSERPINRNRVAEGKHRVEMTAWLPGFDEGVSAAADIDLSCPTS